MRAELRLDELKAVLEDFLEYHGCDAKLECKDGDRIVMYMDTEDLEGGE